MSHIHIPDGVLPFWLWSAGWVVALIGVGIAGRLAERADRRRKVPLLGVVCALMLVAMSSEIVPIAYHVNLTVIGGVLLGPALSVTAAFVVEVVLAMLGHGGVTVLGLNTVLVGSEMLLGWLAFRTLSRFLGRSRVRITAFWSTVLTLAISTTMLVGIVAVGGGPASSRETGALDPATLRFDNPFSEGVFSVGLLSGGERQDSARPPETPGLSLGRFAAVVYTLGPLGWILEGLLTAAILGYVARVRPSLVFAGALSGARHRIVGHEAGGR